MRKWLGEARQNEIDIGEAASEARLKLGLWENFSRPRTLDRWKTPLLHELQHLNDEQLTILRCLIDEEHYLLFLSA